MLGYKTPNKTIDLNKINDKNTIEQLKHTKIGKIIFDHEMQKMQELLQNQNVNKATKKMIDEFITIAKNNSDFQENAFVKEYLK